MTGPLSKIGKAAKAIKKATAKAPVKTFKTADGYTFYELPNGSIVDNLKPSQVDMSWPSRQEFMSDMEGTAFEAGDELGQRRATTESIGVPTQERLMENITQFGEDDISNFYKARREQLIDQERKANIKLVPGQEEDMAAGGALKKTIKAAQKVGEKSARQEALNMARGIAKESFVRPSQEKGVVYHGTNKDITKFKRTLTPDDHVPGISVTDDPASASLYAEDKAMKQTAGEGANVLPLLVRTEKPMYYPDLEDWTRNKALEKGFPIKDPDDFAAFDVPPETLLKWLKEEGYDAIDYRDDPMMGYGLRVFDPEQLKSAIGNRTYDPRNPDITKAKGGAIDHDLKAWHEKNMASGGIVKLGKAVARAAKKSTLPAFGGSYDNSVVKRAKEEFMTTHGMDVGQSLSKDYDFVDLKKIKPAEKVSEKRVEELMNALENEDPFNTKIPPVIIDSDGNVLDGHHRIEAAKRLGIKSVPAIEKFETQSGTKLVDNFEQGRAKGGAIDHDLKAWHEKNMAKGGEVRMSNGGSSEYEGFFESGLPPSPIADEILVGRGVRRKAPRIGEIFETPAQAVQGALGAFGSAGKGALQATVGLPGDIISLGRGVGAAVSPQPGEDRLGAFLRGMEGETGLPTTEDVKKFLDQYGKAPFEQFETLGEFTGVPILAAPKVSGAIGRAAEDVAPYLRDLPVGASIKPVGPGGEKVSINELIRRLEAGEEMTPEEMQKAQYSKAQKEKYAQANIAKAQKEPAPKEEAVKVPANEMGFFSSVEKAAANLKREEGSGDAFLSDIMKFNPSAGELEATGIVDFLKGKKNVTRQEVQDYIDQHSIQIEEVVRGTILDDVDRQKLNDINRRISRGFGYTITPEEEKWFEATRERLAQFKEPRFEREGLILPNGKNYKEILLKFPSVRPSLKTMSRKDYDEAVRRADELGLKNFETSHWPDDPNTFMHLRMQDMTIGGKKTLVIEEIQSDWHQEGRVKGYKDPKQFIDYYDPTYVAARQRSMELLNEFNRNNANPARQEEIRPLLDEARRAEEEIVDRRNRAIEGVPNAPFKKDWYQLGVKRLLKYAADNDYDQVALVGPDEQIRRGSLGTHIDGLIYEKNADGTIKLMAEKGESVVLDKTVDPKDLDLYVGKDVAKKILESKETDGTLTGDDLKIGGEGMRQYYGRNYPEYMNKLGKKYGTEAKKTQYTISEFGPDNVETVPTGEVDRYGREVMAYQVKDPDSEEVIAFEYDFEKALKEANKKAPATDMWLMDLPAKMKSDVKIGQPFKEGGAVTKDKDLMRWHKIQQLATGGAIKRLAESAKDKPWMKYAKSDKDKR